MNAPCLQCGELGYLQSSNAAVDPSLPTARSKQLTLDAYLSNCKYLFPGAQLTASEREAPFNAEFGGVTPFDKNISQIMYAVRISPGD